MLNCLTVNSNCEVSLNDYILDLKYVCRLCRTSMLRQRHWIFIYTLMIMIRKDTLTLVLISKLKNIKDSIKYHRLLTLILRDDHYIIHTIEASCCEFEHIQIVLYI